MLMSDYHGMTFEQFSEYVSTYKQDGNIFPKGISDAQALKILFDHFIPSDWYITYPCSHEQANTEMVGYILEHFPPGKIKRIPKFPKKEIYNV